MPIRLLTSGGGTTTIQPTTSASSVTLTIPSVNANVVTTGDTASVTQAMLGSGLAGTGPAFSAYNTPGQSVGTGSFTKIQMDTKHFDTGTCYNNTGSTATLNSLSVPSYSFCPNVAGYYSVGAFISAYGSPAQTGECQGAIYKNGSLYMLLSDSNSSTWGVGGGTITMYLNGSGDYIGFYILLGATSGGNMGKPNLGYFCAHMVRGA